MTFCSRGVREAMAVRTLSWSSKRSRPRPALQARTAREQSEDTLRRRSRHRRPRRDQGLPRARARPGREGRDIPHPRRLGGRGLQDPREVRDRVLRPLGVDARGGRRAVEKIRGGRMTILIDESTTFIVQGITGREAVNLTRECLDYGAARRSSAASPRAARAARCTACPCSTPSQQAVEDHGGPSTARS